MIIKVFSDLRRNAYKTGWTDLLFMNNFVHWNNNLMLHSWFIAVNVQLCIIGIPLLHLLRKKPKLTVILMAISSLVGCIVVCITLALNDYPPAMLMMTAQYE